MWKQINWEQAKTKDVKSYGFQSGNTLKFNKNLPYQENQSEIEAISFIDSMEIEEYNIKVHSNKHIAKSGKPIGPSSDVYQTSQ